MIIYRIITSNDSALRKLWEEGWILSCISEGKMYFFKEEKKKREKSLAIISSELLEFQSSMRTACWVSRFKETADRELSMVKNCKELVDKIWIDEFMYRLKTILEDDFKSKHANKLTYLYRELSAFITPIVKVKEKESVMDIVL